MNKEQIIEEMTKILENSCNQDCNHPTNCDLCQATLLYNAGYRKISEVEKWTIREISEGIENIIAEFERLKAVGFKHDDKWRFENLVSDIRDFMKEYEEQKNGKADD